MTSPPAVRVLPMGDAALLLQCGPDARPGAVPARWAALLAGLDGVEETVPAARTVLVRLLPGADPARVAAAAVSTLQGVVPHPAPHGDSPLHVTIRHAPTTHGTPDAPRPLPAPDAPAHPGPDGPDPDAPGAAPATLHVVRVRHDGADLAEVAHRCGLDVPEVVRRHLAVTYTVAFCGFAPGFAYLDGLDPALHLPRREVPRTRVPAGSLAVAGPWTAVYPGSSPGGWHLLGTAVDPLWHPARHGRGSPAPWRPGDRVRFVPAPAEGDA